MESESVAKHVNDSVCPPLGEHADGSNNMLTTLTGLIPDVKRLSTLYAKIC